MHRHARAFAHHAIDHRAVAPFVPARATGLAEDKLGGARLVAKCRKSLDHAARRDRRGLSAQPLRQFERGGQLARIGLAERKVARGFDVHAGPRRTQRVGHALGGAHQCLRAEVL